ncbi:hypothetical protein NIES2135_53670 [Leptolyngbya boryana NIES-2135]|jgi:hypothetical protein|uniref:Uncharacterized protein n=1 Tax=Leptolyngbya boryana NIES-2135 TaxID=1973484 RepID=A0A1Z4JP49_LEPBY|nr:MULTISPECIES: hypothetical protein [Leptolyngbya]BAY58494.1 hypothetical protein NIES2135_53670 [Leptolyngbya boryana NIES-2135]MBD2370969.1 hypothetical protein [Leptolyngbya sp. FACHB-161]MBD2377483.1 hypothetical protein [Leptolyngbya sp. FACHB-238]MBD2401891.1 hypothetical protein [Leptolyngbya sp. FACHB-239]MBD2408409.1 hypothetical protein [Leptolyngbya sp. FACHB-402]
MPAIVPPHSKTVAFQLAIADYLQQQTGIDWREFSDILPVQKSGGLNYSALVSFTQKESDRGDEYLTNKYRVQTRFRCSGNDKRVVDESLGDWCDFLDGLLLRCVDIRGTFRSVNLYAKIRLEPRSPWILNIKENQDEGAAGTIYRTWELEI